MNTPTYNISVIVITHNEENNIANCLSTVDWAGEIILVDSLSTDRTVELAKRYTQNIFIKKWEGYGAAKNFAIDQARFDWILSLDADERVTPELALEVKKIVSISSENIEGYEVARRAYFLNKWIKHCGWYPGYVIRLFKRTAVRFNEKRVHENVEVIGSVGKLENDILHFTDATLFHYLEKFNQYTTLAAEDARERGKKCSVFDLTVRVVYMFVKMFFLRRGFLDGMHGFVLSLLSANYVFVKYAKLRKITGQYAKKLTI